MHSQLACTAGWPRRGRGRAVTPLTPCCVVVAALHAIETSVSETIRKPPLVKVQTALRKQKKYGEKRFSIWRIEFLYPAMWHDHHNVAAGSGKAILEFYIWFRFRPHHRSRHVILHQSGKFYPNRTTLGRKNDVMSIFKMAPSSILGVQ